MSLCDRLLFGISGLPIGTGKKLNYAAAIPYLKDLGLDAMEMLFVRSVNVSDKNKVAILDSKVKNGFYLSAHGSYYINLNADMQNMQQASIRRITEGAEALAKVQSRSLVFHAGYYLNDSQEKAYATVKKNLARLPNIGIQYRLETTGKRTQFGTLEELVSICKEVDSCNLCVDFAHIHARGIGSLKKYDDFARILEFISRELGRRALDDLHIHMGGIAYSSKGENHHLPVRESDFNYKACLRALKDFKVKGCVICEGPRVEKDAIFLKTTFKSL